MRYADALSGHHSPGRRRIAGRAGQIANPFLYRNTLVVRREELLRTKFPCCVVPEDKAAEIDAGIRVRPMEDADTLVVVDVVVTADDAWLGETLLP